MRVRSSFLLALLAIAGCASAEPIVMEPRFAPPFGHRWISRTAGDAPACRINLAGVRDTRSDTQTMGALGQRVVRARDSAAWLRAGFEALGHDARVVLVAPTDAAPGLGLNVELIKAHVASVNMAKTANVVVRVTFAPAAGQASERLLRGEVSDVNWGSGDNEALDLMNAALAEVVAAAHTDVIALCDGATGAAG